MSAAFEQWIRRQAPPTSDDVGSGKLLGARLEDRLHQKRQARRSRLTGMIAAAIVLIVVGFVDVNPLGSNDRELLVDPDRPDEISHPLRPGVGSLTFGTRESYERIIEAEATGLRTLVMAFFYRVGDEVSWSVGYDFWTPDGIGEMGGEPTSDQVSTMSKSTFRWLYPQIIDIEGPPTDESWQEITSQRHRIDGHLLWFRIWAKETDRGIVWYGFAQTG